jgi:hypothetical protein
MPSCSTEAAQAPLAGRGDALPAMCGSDSRIHSVCSSIIGRIANHILLDDDHIYHHPMVKKNTPSLRLYLQNHVVLWELEDYLKR